MSENYAANMQSLLILTILTTFIPTIIGLTLGDLYPFGNQIGDTAMERNDDGSSGEIPISTLFPFFNHQHQKLIVNTNGVISFLSPVGTYTPNPFPIANDARMIAPFWADIDTRKGGTVWYRETTEDSLLDRATDEIKDYFPQFLRFRASWIFIATWENVAFFGCASEGCLKRNTFQAVLITNGQHSFTIYNFENIQWTTGTASGGSSSNGLGGTPAQVGFNAGDGIVYFTVNASRTPDIVDVDELSNVNIPGKFAFRIDANVIVDGGCNVNGYLTITPHYGPMLGGQYVVINGPCIEENATISLSINGLTPKRCERKSEFSMVCITPMFTYVGDALFLISLQDSTKPFIGRYTILNPAVSKHKVYRHNHDDWSSGSHQISWDPGAAELQDDDKVDIHLFSLKEGTNRALTWEKTVLKQGIGRSIGTTQVFLQTNQNDYGLALRVTAATLRTNQHERGIWSNIFPRALPPNEALSFCQNWLNAEAQMTPLPSDNAQPCPCTLDQALLDIVRFQPDPDCNMFNRESWFSRTGNCLHRRDATHCIRMTELGQNVDNLCCYDQGNNLIDSRLKEGGSLQRYHYLGGSQIIPYLHNFYFDVLPFLYCCRYSQNVYIVENDDSIVVNECPSFFTQRKFSSCVNYVPPRPARTNGDPHITTLDGYSYTFNGVGEFFYMKTMDETFHSHIRFEQFQKENGELVDASVCTAFASQHFNTSGVIEVRLNSIRTADVLIDGTLLDFDESLVHQYPGLYVMQTLANQSNINTTRKEFIVSFTEIGIAFKVIASAKVLNILPVVGNTSLAGTLRGLLGDFDENPDNELQTPSGEMLSRNSTSEEIYDGFGVLWRITENISLFTYEPGKSYHDYQKLSFRPTFSLPSNLSPEVEELCGTDQECAFDYLVTDSADFAAETLHITEIFNTSVGASYEIKNCEDLPSVLGGIWNATNTIEGSTATFSCYPGYEIQGTSNIVTCTNNSWGSFGNFSCNLIRTSTSSTFVTTTSSTSTEDLTSTIQPTTSATDDVSSQETTTYSTTTNQPTTAETSTRNQRTTSTTESKSTTASTTSSTTTTVGLVTTTEKDPTTDRPTSTTEDTSTTTSTTSHTTTVPLTTTTTMEDSTTNQPTSSTPYDTKTMTPTTSTTAEVTMSTSTFHTTTTNEVSSTSKTTTALPTTANVPTTTTTLSSTTPSVTTTSPTTTTTEADQTTIFGNNPTTLSTTDTPVKTTQHSTTEETSMTSEIQSTTTSDISRTLKQFEIEIQKILPYLIGSVIIIVLLVLFVGFCLYRRSKRK
uniref:Protein mesh-like n=1 Tax=Crassostrea virginica TaxID=6565 RepID=A0A8B8D7W4_CRAVI|nr:protein mesh-like [Crassostrea virginica]